MKRKIILVSLDDDADAPDMQTRIDIITVTAEQLNFAVVTNEVVHDNEPVKDADNSIVSLAGSEDERTRAQKSGVATLNELTGLTAYQAWQQLGGVTAERYRKGIVRGKGDLFHAVCRAMVKAGLSFADANPASFRRTTRAAWMELVAKSRITDGVTHRDRSHEGRMAGVLHNMELMDETIFARVTDDEIDHFAGCHEAYVRLLILLRQQLVTKQ